ncbi:MAG: hypothetical protein VW834_03575, partial [Synechococcus sp.]
MSAAALGCILVRTVWCVWSLVLSLASGLAFSINQTSSLCCWRLMGCAFRAGGLQLWLVGAR